MKFSVGYQLREDSNFIEEIIRYRDEISEVYFSWGAFANGRNNQLLQIGLTPWQAQQKQEEDIRRLSENGIPLNILFNAMCYGEDSQARSFFVKVGETIDYIQSHYGLASVTTTSPLIAKFVQENFMEIDVRASVNMGIGTVESMEYVKDFFDSFYMQRELNRDFDAIRKLKKWCDENGKTLYALANSGCLNYCSAHVFHDNLVAHESQIATRDNGYAFEGVCKTFVKNPLNHRRILECTGFIRPEDIYLYEEFFPAMKLATRVNENPGKVLRSYINRRHIGSVLSLLEPNHTRVLYPYMIDNDQIESCVKEGKLHYINTDRTIVKLEESVC